MSYVTLVCSRCHGIGWLFTSSVSMGGGYYSSKKICLVCDGSGTKLVGGLDAHKPQGLSELEIDADLKKHQIKD